MTARYVVLPKPPQSWGSETEYGWQERPTVYVIESDPSPVDTGLLDANGDRLYRVPDRVPLGFCR